MNEKLYNEIQKYEPFDEEDKIEKDAMLYFIKTNEDVLTRNNPIGHFSVSGWVINKDRTKVLMIYHNIYKTWAWMGGHADGDDDLKRVIIKEINEETGIKNVKFLCDSIFSLKTLTVKYHVKNGKYVNSHLHFDIQFLLEADEEEKLRIKADENSGVKWIDIDKIKEYVTEEKMIPYYEKLNRKIGYLNEKNS